MEGLQRLGAIRELVRLAVADEVPSKETVTFRAPRTCATSSNDATSHERWRLNHMEELEALLAQVQSLTQRMLSLEELSVPSIWPDSLPDSTRFGSEPI